MIRIMILDDEEYYLEKEKRITEDFFVKNGIPCQVNTCQNVEWFLMGIQDENYDLYILDVEMPGRNGLEAAKELRKVYPEPTIIFITNYVDYAVEAYEVNTYRYIPKGVLDTKLTEAYDTLLPKILENEEQYYVVEKKGQAEKIAFSDIFYLKKEGKYVIITHRRGESKVRKSLLTVSKELNSREFLQIDKSYIANIHHIMKLSDYDAYMRDGVKLPIGIARFKAIRQTVLDFWR